MAVSIAGVLWQPVRLICECRGRCLPGGARVKPVALDVAVAQPGDDTHGMVVVDRRSWADAPRVTYGPEGLDDYLGSTLTYSQVPPRANAAVKVVTVLTNVNASEFRKELAFRFRKNAMRYFTKY